MIKRKLRIGHFQPGYPEPDGITNVVRGLSRALVNLGHSVVIYGCGPAESLPVSDTLAGLQVALFNAPSNPFRLPKTLIDRLKTNEDKLDLLVIHGMFHPATARVGRYAALGAIPYVVCPHCPYDPNLLGKHWLRKAVYGSLFEKPLLRRAAAVQVFSSKHAQLLRHYGVMTPPLIVPNGLDPSDMPALEPDSALLPGDPKILFLGRLDSHHKGLDLLIRAFAGAIHGGGIPATTVLTIVGPDSEDSASLRRIVKRQNVASQVVFWGKAVDPERWLLLRSCDLFALSSRFDGFATSVLEAMTAGKPLLLSTETANTDWILEGNCAFFVEPSVDSIRNGLIRAVRERSQWHEMGLSGRAFASRQLTWSRAAALASNRYIELVERLRPSPRYILTKPHSYRQYASR